MGLSRRANSVSESQEWSKLSRNIARADSASPTYRFGKILFAYTPEFGLPRAVSGTMIVLKPAIRQQAKSQAASTLHR
jgi:hypothetical protein